MSSRIAVCGQHPVSTATIRSVGQHLGTSQRLGVLGREDVVRDHGERELVAQELAQRTDERRLAAADRTTDADPQRPLAGPWPGARAGGDGVRGRRADGRDGRHRVNARSHGAPWSGDEESGGPSWRGLRRGSRSGPRRAAGRSAGARRRPVVGIGATRSSMTRALAAWMRGTAIGSRPSRRIAARRDGGGEMVHRERRPRRAASPPATADERPEHDRLVRPPAARCVEASGRPGAPPTGAQQLAAHPSADLARAGARPCGRPARVRGRRVCRRQPRHAAAAKAASTDPGRGQPSVQVALERGQVADVAEADGRLDAGRVRMPTRREPTVGEQSSDRRGQRAWWHRRTSVIGAHRHQNRK